MNIVVTNIQFIVGADGILTNTSVYVVICNDVSSKPNMKLLF